MTYGKQYKVFLIIFADTVVNPRAMMIHFPNTSKISLYLLSVTAMNLKAN